jgi:biopolymer transport protein ExbB
MTDESLQTSQDIPADQAVDGEAMLNKTPGEMAESADLSAQAEPGSATLDNAPDTMVEPATAWLNDALALLDTGGPVVALLLMMSVVALTVVLVKLFQFQRARLWQRKPAQRALALWQQGKVEGALNTADASANPTAQALARAIRGQRRQLPEVAVREEVLRYGSDALFQLRRGLRPLEVIGSLAPLLGLLGTVLGMISAFQQLEAAGNKVNPAILSGGIWEALLTTAVGLCVAIPVVALLNWLERRVDHLAHEMDNLVTQVFTEDLSAAAERHEVEQTNAIAVPEGARSSKAQTREPMANASAL